MADSPIELVLPRFILTICIKFCHLFTQPMIWVCQIYIYPPVLGRCKIIFLIFFLVEKWDIKIYFKQVP